MCRGNPSLCWSRSDGRFPSIPVANKAEPKGSWEGQAGASLRQDVAFWACSPVAALWAGLQDGAQWETAWGSSLMGVTTVALSKCCEPDLPHLQTQICFYQPPITIDTHISYRQCQLRYRLFCLDGLSCCSQSGAVVGGTLSTFQDCEDNTAFFSSCHIVCVGGDVYCAVIGQKRSFSGPERWKVTWLLSATAPPPPPALQIQDKKKKPKEYRIRVSVHLWNI